MEDKIVQFLKSADGYLSGEEISRDLKMSRAAVWKHIEELRKDGYEIVAVPHQGYQLLSSPDKLLPVLVQSGLQTKILGKEIIYQESVESTMDIAFRLGMEGAKEGTLICAETQTKGRGRMGRSWSSPKEKGIYFSLILRPKASPTDTAKLTLLTAVALCEAVTKETGLKPVIKWPNDVLINNRKLAGILTELSAEMDRVRFVIIGIGVNANTPLNLLPANATSIKNELGQPVSRIKLLQEILGSLENWYEIFKVEGFNPVVKKWKQLSVTLGKRVRVVDSGGTIEGVAMDLDQYGGLIIRDDSGMKIIKMAGDVVQV